MSDIDSDIAPSVDENEIREGLRYRLDHGSTKYHRPSSLNLRLTDLAAHVCALHLSFDQLENNYQKIVCQYSSFGRSNSVCHGTPEQLFTLITKHCFPNSAQEIKTYSQLGAKSADAFELGERIYASKLVGTIYQIGYRVVAKARDLNDGDCHDVSIVVDRCVITSTECTCEHCWCEHIIAVCLKRLTEPESVQYRHTLLNSISSFGSTDLIKLVQYFVNVLPHSSLVTLQEVVDELHNPNSAIRLSKGVPDPTDGDHDVVPSWNFDTHEVDHRIRECLIAFVNNISKFLNFSCISEQNCRWIYLLEKMFLNALFTKLQPEEDIPFLRCVVDMFNNGDSNAVVLLHTITINVLTIDHIIGSWYLYKLAESCNWLLEFKLETTSDSSEVLGNIKVFIASSQLCDRLVQLWKLAALNPRLNSIEREQLESRLKAYHLFSVKKIAKIIANETSQFFKLTVSTTGEVLSSANARFNAESFPGFIPAMKACHLDYLSSSLVDLPESIINTVKNSQKANCYHTYPFLRKSPSMVSEEINKWNTVTVTTGVGNRSHGRQLTNIDLDKINSTLEDAFAEAHSESNRSTTRFDATIALQTHGYAEEALQMAKCLAEKLLATAPSSYTCTTFENAIVPYQAQFALVMYRPMMRKNDRTFISCLRGIDLVDSTNSAQLIVQVPLKEVVQVSERIVDTLSRVEVLLSIFQKDPAYISLRLALGLWALTYPMQPLARHAQEVKCSVLMKQIVQLMPKLEELEKQHLTEIRQFMNEYEVKYQTIASEFLLSPLAPHYFNSLFLKPTTVSNSFTDAIQQPDIDKAFSISLFCTARHVNYKEEAHQLMFECHREQLTHFFINALTAVKDEPLRVGQLLDRLLDPSCFKIYKCSKSNAYYFFKEAGKKDSIEANSCFSEVKREIVYYDFLVEMAQSIIKEGGGNTANLLYFPQPSNEHTTSFNLSMAGFIISLYAYGVSKGRQDLQMRHDMLINVTWLFELAIDIGTPAIEIIAESWTTMFSSHDVATFVETVCQSPSPEVYVYFKRLAINCLKMAHRLTTNECVSILQKCSIEPDIFVEAALVLESVARKHGKEIHPSVFFYMLTLWDKFVNSDNQGPIPVELLYAARDVEEHETFDFAFHELSIYEYTKRYPNVMIINPDAKTMCLLHAYRIGILGLLVQRQFELDNKNFFSTALNTEMLSGDLGRLYNICKTLGSMYLYSFYVYVVECVSSPKLLQHYFSKALFELFNMNAIYHNNPPISIVSYVSTPGNFGVVPRIPLKHNAFWDSGATTSVKGPSYKIHGFRVEPRFLMNISTEQGEPSNSLLRKTIEMYHVAIQHRIHFPRLNTSDEDQLRNLFESVRALYRCIHDGRVLYADFVRYFHSHKNAKKKINNITRVSDIISEYKNFDLEW